MEHVGGLLASAARLEIMPRFHRLTAASVREKSSSFDVVTEADEAAETVIAEGLRAAFPHAAIIGEEAAERDPSLLQGLGSAELAFLIDPLASDACHRGPDLRPGSDELASGSECAFR
jgi:fructose-1,6-bisphosphatase/inositol monophosphatase family enzyme